MRKDLKKRLERALITLQEPGGSTIRSIVKVINHDSPVLSLRKVLEALQEGINEGFLCMYNGRFKLRQQLYSGKDTNLFDNSEMPRREKKKENNKPDCNFPNDDSDDELEEEEEKKEEEEDDDDDDDDGSDDEDDDLTFTLATDAPVTKDNPTTEAQEGPDNRSRKMKSVSRNKKRNKGKRQKQPGKTRIPSKKTIRKPVGKKNYKLSARAKPPRKTECLLLADSSSTIPEAKSSKPTSDKPDLRRQRGPRCTSMKKDIRMPSKVHIPFVSPSVPQKGGNFNDLVRRSPDPVNGPLFDDFRVGLGFFESYC